jgi:3-hydroxybutyryl-CoA dehydrogenase
MPVPAELKTVAVIGNGIVGHGIAQVFATAHYSVRLIGRNPPSLEAAIERIRGSLSRFVAHGLVTTQEAEAAIRRIVTSTNLEDAAGV